MQALMFSRDLKSQKSQRSSAGMSKMSKRSKSTGNLKNNLKLPEIIISNEPKTKLINWREILQNPFKLRDTPTFDSITNCMFTKHASQIEDSVMIFH